MKITRNQKIGIAGAAAALSAGAVAAVLATKRPIRNWFKSKFNC